MAIIDVDLQCTGAALVRSDHPDTNYHGADRYQLDGQNSVPYGTYLLLKFESLPSTYHYRNILGVSLNFTCDRNIPLAVKNTSFFWETLKSGFDEETVTWNNKPDSKDYFYDSKSPTHGTGDEQISIPAYIKSSGSDGPDAGYAALTAPGIALYCQQYLYGTSYANVYTNAAANGKKPFLRVSLTDTNASVSVDKKPINGITKSWERFACNKPSNFSWDINRVYGFTYADVVQDSATLYWRRKGATSWSTVNISGSDQSYTLPANVLPAADIEWTVIPVCGNFNVIASTEYTVNAYPRYFAELPMTAAAMTQMDKPSEVLPWINDSYNSVYHYSMTGGNTYERDAYFMFAPLQETLQYRAIEAAAIQHFHLVSAGWISEPHVYTLESTFDQSRLTWDNAPTEVDEVGHMLANNRSGTTGMFVHDALMPYTSSLFPSINNVLGYYSRNGTTTTDPKEISLASRTLLTAPAVKIAMLLGYYSSKGYSGLIYGDPAPVLVVMLFETTITSTVVGETPTAGWVNPHISQTFSWKHIPDGDYSCAADWQSASATLFWSADNGSTWNSVAAPANSQNVILPAETLPAGTIQWYVTATDDRGTTSTSPTYTITTEDSETTATPIAPINTVEDGSAPIRFLWETENNHGTAQTAADLQKSTDGSTWETLGTVTGSENSFTAQADTFLNGNVYWRVRAYNADGTAGPWSEAATFKAFNAPPAPVVSASEVPFSAVTWQSEGQEAWRITVDGTVYGPYFGGSKRFEIPTYLENGGHTITVEVQGASEKWSKPGTAIVQVQNVPGDPVALSGSFERDAELSWETASQTADFLIYRDGVRIGHTSGMKFADRTVLGGHRWQVINRLPSGNYTASNTVYGKLCTKELAIALLSGGDWLELTMSRNPTRQETYSLSQVVSLTHFAGQEYPEAEVSPYKTLQGSFDVSWPKWEEEQAAAFEAMIGKPSIYKAPSGETMVGILAAIQKNPVNFFKAYAATIQRINWRDFVDEDN